MATLLERRAREVLLNQHATSPLKFSWLADVNKRCDRIREQLHRMALSSSRLVLGFPEHNLTVIFHPKADGHLKITWVDPLDGTSIHLPHLTNLTPLLMADGRFRVGRGKEILEALDALLAEEPGA
jgi:hypothetical protein